MSWISRLPDGVQHRVFEPCKVHNYCLTHKAACETSEFWIDKLQGHFGVTDFTTIDNPRREYNRICSLNCTTMGLVRLFYLLVQTFYDPNNFTLLNNGNNVQIRVTQAHMQMARDLIHMRFHREEARRHPSLDMALSFTYLIRRARDRDGDGSFQITTLRRFYGEFKNSFQYFLWSQGINNAHEDFTSRVAHMDFETFRNHLNMEAMHNLARRILVNFMETIPPPAPVPQ